MPDAARANALVNAARKRGLLIGKGGATAMSTVSRRT